MKTIDAKLLKKMFISASNNLYNHYPEIDALNVFPVPDGDTGLNMNLTLQSGVKEINNRNDDNVGDLSKAFARGLFMGGRGNSGSITAQIFKGFSLALEGKKDINVQTLAEAFKKAKEIAYKVVKKPVEGTILTVCRESSDALYDKYEKINDVEEAFREVLIEARASLKRTPELLPVLKEVGVVDSGGCGYVTILEGMYCALKGKPIEKNVATSIDNTVQSDVTGNMEGDEFGYCTEFILEVLDEDPNKKVFNFKSFVSSLEKRGNSIVASQDENFVKIHIHTLTPGWVLTFAQQFGEFKKIKVENMTEQHHELMLNEEAKAKMEEKPSKPVAKKGPKKEYGMIAVAPGDGIAEMFKEIGVDEIVKGGQTMNPSTEDFVEAINKINAKKIFIFPNNSNIVLAASQACDVIEDDIDARVIPCSSVPQGLVASMNFNEEDNVDDNFKAMKRSLRSVKSGSVTYAVRDTEIDGIKVNKDEYMALADKKILCCLKDKFEALDKALEKMVNSKSSIITIFTGEDISDEEFDALGQKLEEKYTEVDIDLRKGNQPVYSFIIGVE